MLFDRVPADFLHGEHRRAYLDAIGRVYSAVRRVAGKKLIVDSSRETSQALLLSSLPNLEVKFLHLVRDSRAVAFSNQRRKLQFKSQGLHKYLVGRGITESAILWGWRNFWASRVAHMKRRNIKYARLRYEDLIRAPRDALAAALTSLGLGEQDLGFIDGTRIRLRLNHAISANPVKFNSGSVDLRLDDEWCRELAARDRRLVTLLTFPLLRRYGYSV